MALEPLNYRVPITNQDGTPTVYLQRLWQELSKDTAQNQVTGWVFVATMADLPAPVSGVINLVANQTYVFTNSLDLGGARLVGNQNTTLLGGSSENTVLTSTGLNSATALVTSNWSLPIRNLTITHGTALNLDASLNANQALDWFGVNFTNCATVGTIKGYNNVIWTDCALLDSAGLTFDGTIGTVGFSQCIFSGRASGTTITLPATANITRRFRLIYCALITPSTGTGINVSASATIPVEGYILDTCNFSGSGTYTTGVAFDDNKSLWVENKGVTNSASIGYMTMNGNATATVVASSGVAYKAAGTTTQQSPTQRFTHSSNRLTYTGAITRTFRVSVIAAFTSTTNNQIGLYVAKNGTIIAASETYATANSSGRAENIVVQSLTELTTNDYVEAWVENDTAANNITVTDLSVIAQAAN